MNILDRYQAQISRMDRNQALIIGILSGVTLLWVVYRLFWLTFSAVAFSDYGLSAFSLVFSFAWTLVIGALAAVNAFVFLRRYKQG